MKIRIAALLLALGIPVSAFATVGGPQNIEVLGYEVKDQKLYLLRHYLDIADAYLNCIIIILNPKLRIS